MNSQLNQQSYRKSLTTFEQQKYYRLAFISVLIAIIFIHKINTVKHLPTNKLIIPFLLTFIIGFAAGLLAHKFRQYMISDESLVEKYGEYYNFLAMNGSGKMNKTSTVIRFIPTIAITVTVAIVAKYVMSF